MKKTKVVVIGGGTGIYPITTALTQLQVEIATIITVADAGGSTGRIRDEFGFQPVGDLRQSLAALAEGDGQNWIAKLLLYRFDKGNSLKGHNLGNLILTALQDMTGNTTKALEIAEKIFRLKGEVIPATESNVDLKITYEDGSSKIGENFLNAEDDIGKRVIKVKLIPAAKINPKAKKEILAADYIIIGPGDYFGTLFPSLLPSGLKSAFKKSQAKIIYLVNLMSRHNQTDTMTAGEYIIGIENLIGKKINLILINSEPIPQKIIKAYEAANEYPVLDDLKKDNRVIRAEIISDVETDSDKADELHRSYLRHDSQKLRKVLKKIIR